MDFCDNNTIEKYFSTANNDGIESQKTMYKYLIPILIIGCIVSVILNSLLVIIGNTKTVNKSPILVLSLNLATTDCLASIFMGVGLIVNSYLPVVFDIDMGGAQCTALVIEIFRLSSLIASAMHLLSLALVHYKGIVKPLHYRAVIFCSQHRTRSIHLMSFICWIIPVIILGVYFVSIPCQGFLHECRVHFILTRRFRLIIVISFFIPLIMMLFLYIRIFTIIKSHQQQRSLTGSVRNFNKNSVTHTDSNPRKTSLSQSISIKPIINNSLKWSPNNSNNNSLRKGSKVSTNGEFDKNSSIKSRKIGSFGLRSNSNVTPNSTKYCFRPQQQVQGHSKALMTTLLILGTYLLCWMPAVVYLALTCINGCPFPLLTISFRYRIIFSFITNGLVIFKAIVDPFIYTYRMKEMKVALNRYCFGRTNARNSKSSQRSGTLTTLRSTSPSSLKHRCAVAETSLN